MATPFKLKNKKDFNFGNKEADYGQKRDFHKKFDYSGEPDPSHEPNVREADKTPPTKFTLRSGNGPLQFKQMGASPVKQVTLDEMAKEEKFLTQQESLTQTKEAIEANNKVREKAAKKKAVKEELKTKGVKDDQGMYILGEMESADTKYDPNKSAKDYEKESKELNLSPEAAKKAEKKNKKKLKSLIEADAEADAKAKVDATRGTERGQVKKQGRLDKIQKRQDKRAYKKYKKGLSPGSQGDMSFEQFKESDQYTDKSTRREERLKKEVNMTPEEYKANQAEKKQKFQDAMTRLSLHTYKFDPYKVAAFDESVRTRGQREETERINNEHKEANTKRMNQDMDAYKKDQERQNELMANILNAQNADGSINDEDTSTEETTKV